MRHTLLIPLLFAFVACGDPPVRSEDTADVADATDGDTSLADTSPDPTHELPSFREYRARSGFAAGVFHMEPDDRHFATVIEEEPIVDGTPTWTLVRVDGMTGEVTSGPSISPRTTLLEAFPSSVPGIDWVFGEGGARLTTLELATLTFGPTLTLPPHDRWRNVIWTWDSSAAAIGFGSDQWDGITVVDLPPDPRTFVPDEVVSEDLLIDPVEFIHIRVSSGGRFIAVSDAPGAPGCWICSPEPERGHFNLYDLSTAEPRRPVMQDGGSFDESFRVSTHGRWLFRDGVEVTGGVHVVAYDLADPTLPSREIACDSVAEMSLGADDTVLCAGAGEEGWQVSLLDAELDVTSSAIVKRATTWLTADDSRTRVLIGAELVDFGVTPPTVVDLGIEDTSLAFADGEWIWILQRDAILRMRWSDPTPAPFPLPATSDPQLPAVFYAQIDALQDGGVAIARSFARIELFGPDGAPRGVIERKLPAPSQPE